MTVKVGTCAFADHDSFYPRSIPRQSYLEYYARYFSVVEIDSTFYGHLRSGTWERWLSLVPRGFTFHVKAHGAMTLHVRDLSQADRRDIASTFIANLSPVRESGQLGLILLQFPPWYRATRENVQVVERVVDACRPMDVAVEFRERSWFATPERTEKTLDWLRGLDAVHVICDEPQVGNRCVPLVVQSTSHRRAILRMHGRNEKMWNAPGLSSSKERFDYRYTKDELSTLLPSVAQLEETVSQTHILMNNNSNNDAVWNAFDWMELLGQTAVKRPLLDDSQQLFLW